MRSFIFIVASMMATVLANGALAAPVQHGVATFNGQKADYYRWTDSKGRPRVVFLKREGQGNPGHGGYAIRMTYQAQVGAALRTIVANEVAGSDGGFGYFVSHERFRDFTDGANNTIAGKIFGKDNSPLGRGFAVTGGPVPVSNPNAAAHRFRLTYPRYGTISPIPKNADGEDVAPTPINPAQFQLYTLPVTLTWIFENGKDYPRIKVAVSLANVTGPDRVNFDLRAPYGVLNFDNGGNNAISTVMWGDRNHFKNTTRPLTRNSAWTWTGANTGARYTALIAGGYEMGLFEPRTFATSTLADGFAFGRGLTSAQYQCDDQSEVLPCDWEWPYQSAQYSLSYEDNDEPTTFEKIAWGTNPYWGTGPSMTEIFDSSTTSEPFNGFPSSKQIVYDICVVLGRTVPGGLTRSAAASPSKYSCASAAP